MLIQLTPISNASSAGHDKVLVNPTHIVHVVKADGRGSVVTLTIGTFTVGESPEEIDAKARGQQRPLY